MTLEQLQDNTRALLIFSPASTDPRLRLQIEKIEANAAGVRERDIALVLLAGAPKKFPGLTAFSLSDEHAAYTRFHVATGSFVVILIGKDGGEKLRSTLPIEWETLRSTIDAMPMRQDEMRRNQH